MRHGDWTHGLALASSLLFLAGSAAAKESPSAETPRAVFFPARGVHAERAPRHLVGKTALLVNHGGPTITSAKVVLIFWGPSFSNTSSPDACNANGCSAFSNTGIASYNTASCE